MSAKPEGPAAAAGSKWAELTEEERAQVVAWMRNQKTLPTHLRRLVLSAADELENPTW